MRTSIVALFVYWALLALFAPPAPAALTLANGHLICTIDTGGIESIALDGHVVTSPRSPRFMSLAPRQGLWADQGFPSPAGSLTISDVRSSVITGDGNSVTLVNHHDHLTAAYQYRLDGNDINFSIAIANHDAALPLSRMIIVLPTFAFGPDVNGNLKSWDDSYLAANIANAFHPGTWSPLAASYARDGHWGLSLHCKSHFDKLTLFNAYLPSPKNGLPPRLADVCLYICDTVPPQSTRTIDVTMRLTTQTDLPTLLASYMRDFRAFAGPMRYTPDDRPWLQFTSFNKVWVRPDNPRGYADADHRLDTPWGIARYEWRMTPSIDNTQGTIFWQPQGYNPRGGEYRPDFDIWPPPVQANLPRLIGWYQSHGLRFGLCARPAVTILPAGPTSDRLVPVNPGDPSQMADLMSRFDHVTAMGVSAFYLDSFGVDLNSYRIMQRIRQHLGSSIPTYSEMTSDLMLPYSGVYTELNPHGEDGGPPDGSTRWYGFQTLAIFHLLYPHCGIIAKNIDNRLDHPMVTTDQLAAWRLTPMIQDKLCATHAAYFRHLIAEQMPSKTWK
jgi:hypothetical protein